MKRHDHRAPGRLLSRQLDFRTNGAAEISPQPGAGHAGCLMTCALAAVIPRISMRMARLSETDRFAFDSGIHRECDVLGKVAMIGRLQRCNEMYPMLPWIHLDRATIPGDAGDLRLKQRGSEFSIMLGSTELMNSRLSGSEEALATLSCQRIAGRKTRPCSLAASAWGLRCGPR